jgi:hypothetical protein
LPAQKTCARQVAGDIALAMNRCCPLRFVALVKPDLRLIKQWGSASIAAQSSTALNPVDRLI